MGHEFAGEVVEIGENVTSVKLGDYVSAETHVVCEKCIPCKTGNAHVCTSCKILGVDMQGAFAEYVKIPETNAWLNDKDVDFGVQSIQEPLGNAIHTVLSGTVVAKTVLITGCGAIGLMAIAVAKAAGAAQVFASDISPYRIELAKKMGATKVYNASEVNVTEEILKDTNGQGVDVICEMSGAVPVIQGTVDMIANGGRISLLGLPTRDVELDLNKIIFKGVTVNGITGRRMYDTSKERVC
jgi:threonine 3-dehydrogenase